MSSSYSHQFSTARSATSALNFDQVEAVCNCYKFVRSWWMISRLFVAGFAGCWRKIPRCESSARQSMESEAVQKAVEFQPDLILLDSDLPKLSGIEAARQIRKSRSQVQDTLPESGFKPREWCKTLSAWGRRGYVTKSDAARELLTAVKAVGLGKQYVSRALAGFDLTDTADE